MFINFTALPFGICNKLDAICMHIYCLGT
jgi:hypothetical protein